MTNSKELESIIISFGDVIAIVPEFAFGQNGIIRLTVALGENCCTGQAFDQKDDKVALDPIGRGTYSRNI